MSNHKKNRHKKKTIIMIPPDVKPIKLLNLGIGLVRWC